MAEKVLTYSRARVGQETYYWCGPATLQNILDQRGISRSEQSLAARMGTTVNGTNHIGLLTTVLRAELPAANYTTVQLPNDPPTTAQKARLIRDVVRSINGGYGVAVNIVAPPSNYPKAVAPSTQNLAYGGGTIYHYVAWMGWGCDGALPADFWSMSDAALVAWATSAKLRFWWTDSGFSPYGGWVSFAQSATLVPPKGYSYANVAVTSDSSATTTAPESSATDADYARDVRAQLTGSTELGKYPGWPQLGGRTVVDALAAILQEVSK